MDFEKPDFNLIERALETIPSVALELDAGQIIVLISQLQLALRHPENVRTSAEIATEIAHTLSNFLGQFDPEIARIIELGWKPEYDMSYEEFQDRF